MTTQTQLRIAECPARLSEEQIAQYREDGFIAFENLLSVDEVVEVRQAMYEFVRRMCREALSGEAEIERGDWAGMRNYSGIKITNKKDFYGLLLEPSVEIDVKKASAEQIDQCYRKLFNYGQVSPVLKRVGEHPVLRQLVADLIGPDPILSGDMALSKPARIGVAKPWHQDMAYFNYLPLDGGVDVWIAIEDATIANGCMVCLPGGHKLGPKMHIHLNDCTIEEGRVEYGQAVPVELKAGGVLLFSPLVPHQTPPNRSEKRRRALQYFFRGAHTRKVTAEEYDEHFVEADGAAATCHAAGLRKKREQSGATRQEGAITPSRTPPRA